MRDFCKEVGLQILISGDTRPYSPEESCIDNILTYSLKVKNKGIPFVLISDHLTVYATKGVKKGLHDRIRQRYICRTYMKYDRIQMCNHLDNFDWNAFWASEDPDYLWRIMIKAITTYLDMKCPVREFKVNEPKNEWMTDEILQYIVGRERS